MDYTFYYPFPVESTGNLHKILPNGTNSQGMIVAKMKQNTYFNDNMHLSVCKEMKRAIFSHVSPNANYKPLQTTFYEVVWEHNVMLLKIGCNNTPVVIFLCICHWNWVASVNQWNFGRCSQSWIATSCCWHWVVMTMVVNRMFSSGSYVTCTTNYLLVKNVQSLNT